MKSQLAIILSAATLLLASGCKQKSAEPPATVGEAPGSAPMGSAAPVAVPPPSAGSLSDPQIAAIVVAANQVDIDAGELALKRSKNEEVKKFAQRMITDHTAVNKSAVDLVTRLKLTPEPSEASRGLTAGGADSRATLDKLDGGAFDRAYVANEVAYHKAVIGVLVSQLIPSATNPELKTTLVSVKPAFDAHLQHAEQVQATLAGGGSGAPGAHAM